MGKVGINLNRAVKTYNDAVGSFEGRVIPKARTIENLTAKAGGDQLDSLKSLDGVARSMSPELVDPTSIDSEVIDHVPAEED